MKIVYCINSIRGLGGIQKVTIEKANALANIDGNEVYVLVTDNWESHPLMRPLSEKIHFIQLGIHYYADDYKSRLHQILSNLKFFKHWKRLQKQIGQINPDVIISVGQNEKYIVPLLKTKAVKIREIHYNSNYRNYTYSSKSLAQILNYIDYKLAARGYQKVVLLTRQDKDTFFPKNDKFIYMHNPLVNMNTICSYTQREKIVVSVGRLDLAKDFLTLIRVWNLVCKSIDDWTLYIVGEGPLRKQMEAEIARYNLSDKVKLLGYREDVNEILKKSSIFALTSLYEGFGLALVEAMNAGLPTVSFSCPFGPKDIITNGINGFLIDNRDEAEMASKIISLIQNESMREELSKSAFMRSKDFSIENIIQQWMDLFYLEINQK